MSNILASLGHNERRGVLGHTLNTQTLMKTKKKSYNLLSKFTLLCWAAFIAILGRMWPGGCGLDTHGKHTINDTCGYFNELHDPGLGFFIYKWGKNGAHLMGCCANYINKHTHSINFLNASHLSSNHHHRQHSFSSPTQLLLIL